MERGLIRVHMHKYHQPDLAVSPRQEVTRVGGDMLCPHVS